MGRPRKPKVLMVTVIRMVSRKLDEMIAVLDGWKSEQDAAKELGIIRRMETAPMGTEAKIASRSIQWAAYWGKEDTNLAHWEDEVFRAEDDRMHRPDDACWPNWIWYVEGKHTETGIMNKLG